MIYRKSIYLALAACLAASASTSMAALQLNEARIDEPGSDRNEYIEIKGDPGESMEDVWFLIIGDHSNFGNPDQEAPFYGSGVVEIAIPLSSFTIPDDGHFVMVNGNFDYPDFGLTEDDIDFFIPPWTDVGIFENSDNITLMLVKGFTGTAVTSAETQWGDKAIDIDPDDAGILVDPLPWTEIIDAVGLVEIPNDSTDPAPEELVYGEILGFEDIGPDRTFVPGHVFRGSNDNAWNIGQFVTFSGDVLNPEGFDTPGAPNPESITPPAEPILTSFSPSIVVEGSIITLTGENFSSVTSVQIGNTEVSYTVDSDTQLRLTVPSGVVGGPITVTNNAGTSVTDASVSVLPAGTAILFLEEFVGNLGDFEVVSAASNRDWQYDSFGGDGFAEMSGFNADVASDDWLITPAIDLTGVESPALQFVTAMNFDGPVLDVWVSSNYTTGTNPTGADWTPLSPALSTGGYEEVPSGSLDLSAYIGSTIHVVFRYTSTSPESGQGSTWQVDDVLVTATGGAFTPGWTFDQLMGWTYYFTEGLGYSAHLGYTYLASAPWVYVYGFGWVYPAFGVPASGVYYYTQSGEWIYVVDANAGWFQYLDGTWGNFFGEGQ